MGWWADLREGGNLRLRRSITALELRVDGLEISNRNLKLEWESVYDKLMKAAARLNARSRRAAIDEAAPEPLEVVPGSMKNSLGTHEELLAARNRRAV